MSMQPRSFTRFFPAIARVLLGLPLFASGLFGLLNLTPQPTTPLPEGAMAFAEALVKTGYMLQLIFITQLTVGALLLTNRFVPLALVLFAPFIVNSILFHSYLEHTGLPIAAIFLLLELYLAWQYRQSYAALLTARATPSSRQAV
jgi:uncharacterized membrane protein YphA (DoxX/SURF4 family)